MSVLGIAARGLEGAMKGGDVLAKGEEKKQEAILWNSKTEITRQNNMDRLKATQEFSKSEREAGQSFKAGQVSTGWTTKEGTPVNKAELAGYEAQAKKAGKTTEEYMRGLGLSTSAEYGETSKRDAQIAAAKKDIDVFLKSPTGKALKISKDQRPNITAQWEQAYVQSLRAGKGSSLTADQFVTQFMSRREKVVEEIGSIEGGVKRAKKDAGFDGSDNEFYDMVARKSVVDAVTAGSAGKGLTPGQTTRVNVRDETLTAEIGGAYSSLKTAQEVQAKMQADQADETLSPNAKRISARVGGEKLESLGGVSSGILGKAVPSTVPTKRPVRPNLREGESRESLMARIAQYNIDKAAWEKEIAGSGEGQVDF